jgi:hypothetical protein
VPGWQAAAVSDTTSAPAPDPTTGHGEELRLRLWFFSVDPHIIIYSTIILMTAYALFDEGTDPLGEGPWAALVGISIAPLFALGMAHAFSEALDLQIRNGRRLTGHDRRELLRTNAQYLYIAVPPILLFGVLVLFDWEANRAVELVLGLGLVSLFLWGLFAGRKAGLSVPRQLMFGFNYALMGLIVLAVELLITH